MHLIHAFDGFLFPAQQTIAPAPKTLSQEVLRKYIMFGRQNVSPTLTELDREKVDTQRLYPLVAPS
jgi:DNA replicative helicase MCM subunit Mcm2 (Cdc46/Mcm family)